MAATLGPILAANTVTFTLYFRTDFTQIALLTGYHLCGCGIAGVLFVASARVWGKRHLYLLGTLLLVVGSIWAGRSRSYTALLWARVIQGVAVAPFEALVNASVGDLFFVHVSFSLTDDTSTSMWLTWILLGTWQTHGAFKSLPLWGCFLHPRHCR